jgi:2-phosphosulfolactate phosphatase
VKIDVATSSGPRPPARDVVVVIDTLRACTSVVTALEQGAADVTLVATVDEARALKEKRPGNLLCGEKDGLPPPGFDLGNSPVELSNLDLTGRNVILATTNGTPLFQRYSRAGHLFAGCLRNTQAVAAAAADLGGDTLLACAGSAERGEPVMEDTYTAGAIVNALVRERSGFTLTSEAQAAFDLYVSFEGNADLAFAQSSHAAYLRSLDFTADIEFCSMESESSIAPLARRRRGLLVACAGSP